MDRLLIIGDDFTGVLDTGIQFTKAGIHAQIHTDHKCEFADLEHGAPLYSVNTDSRPLSAEAAYDRVYELTLKAIKSGIEFIYKKTDSGLRGNIGAELKAAMDACGERTMAFIPAFPRMDRVTIKGIHYISGVPVKDSVFGQDPFEPVKYNSVEEIIKSTADVDVVSVAVDEYEKIEFNYSRPTIVVFDACTDDDLTRIAAVLKKKAAIRLIAGCAGFAPAYEKLISLPREQAISVKKTGGLMALCGSVNQITVNQLKYAEEQGFYRMHLSNEEKLFLADWDSDRIDELCNRIYDAAMVKTRLIVDTLDSEGCETTETFAKRNGLTMSDVRGRIAASLGLIGKKLVERGLEYTLSMTGGDTLMGFMKACNKTELTPVCEIGNGAVLSVMSLNGKEVQVISKSGGFGEKDIFEQMYKYVV